ncbi:pyruvate kinase [Polymorphobacter fuscus]|uniref:Pyruvate kinase n=1 Tax=Sandarakinorhabdus fusca TaxID=1439888 RepID=A0A7C9GQC4_9SPHN|nr:pyruvate kinase [Polymorphobacter fuscus]KAB7646329.1 pyruvate kinase [Polymorphobacter fuscus]MQT17553.1 pyruvate kinase [Polymorphobacter fuscus]NJC09905.1 pyruvate kinase [Polymorphobacter fuscus]
MAAHLEPRARRVKVLATLGPASNSESVIAALLAAGADAFRVNMSHGTLPEKAALIAAIRAVEKSHGRPLTILADLQGPKLRVGRFAGGSATLVNGSGFRLDRVAAPGDDTRVHLPHKELFAALRPGARLLIDDGKLVLRVTAVATDAIDCRVEVGGRISDNKGVNVPDVVVPLPALTPKDRADLAFALDQGVDWVALSFVQRPEDVAEARAIIGNRAALLAKIEKPAALERLAEILERADAVMVARGDLGVELPPQQVPPAQKRIVAMARALGKPVVVATQMLESMIVSPSPTRAEVSDVATAIYDGADAVMLSAESAAGQFPVEAVAMMDAIAREVEADPGYYARVHFSDSDAGVSTADAISAAAASISHTIKARSIVCFTLSGSTARRAARERAALPVLCLTPRIETARRMGLVWGVHAVVTRDITSFEEMVEKAKRMALRTGIGRGGDPLVLIAGVPFSTPGTTNVVHVVRLTGDELNGR